MTKAEFKELRGNEKFLISWKGLRPFQLKNFAGGCAFGWFQKDGESVPTLHRVPWTLLKIQKEEAEPLPPQDGRVALLATLEKAVEALKRELGVK